MGSRGNVGGIGGGGSGGGGSGGVVAASKTASSGVYSLSRVMGQSVASFAVASFISLLFCFSVPVFCLR